MFDNSTIVHAESKKKIRYEPIDRRKAERRSANGDRRSETREDGIESDRRQQTDRRHK